MEEIIKFLVDRGIIGKNDDSFIIENENGEKINIIRLISEFTDIYKDKHLRVLAEFENFKKRVIKQKEQLKYETILKTIEPLLDTHNDLSIAFEKTENEEARNNFKIVLNKINKSLNDFDITVAQTEQYDVDLHDVINVQTCEKFGILEVVSNGYMLGDKVLRHPKIILGKCDDNK